MATIFVDDRENAIDRANGRKRNNKKQGKSPMAYLETVFDADNRLNGKKTSSIGGGIINYKITRLTVADYCIVLRGNNGENIVVAAIERKKWADLAATIGSSRADTQPRDLRLAKLKYGCFVYYIAEGAFSYADNTKIGGSHGKEFKSLHSKLRHELIRGIPFIQTKDAEHTVQMLTKMARDFIKMYSCKELHFPLQEKTTMPNRMMAAYAYHLRQVNNQFRELSSDILGKDSYDVMAAIDLIDEEINYISLVDEDIQDTPCASDVLNTDFLEESLSMPELFTTQRGAGDSDIIAAMWEAIPGITQNSAPVIREEITLADLFSCKSQAECVAYEEKIYDMQFPSGTRIGKQSKKIMGNFWPKNNRKETAIKVLCAIPRLTEPIAKTITEEYEFSELCNPSFNATNLRDLQIINGTRKIGPAISKKIIELLQ